MKSELETLYDSVQSLKELGLPMNEQMSKEIDALEEKLIKTKVLPALSKNVEPLLTPIRRDLVLVLEYHPGEDISVRLSRKVKIADALGAKILEPDPQVQHKEGKKGSAKPHNAPRTILRVNLPDGSFIQEPKANETFVKAIQLAGVLKVRALGLSYSRVPLVSNTIDKKYGNTQHPVGNGFYVFTNTGTAKKKEQLDRISKALNLGWSVEIIK